MAASVAEKQHSAKLSALTEASVVLKPEKKKGRHDSDPSVGGNAQGGEGATKGSA
jgi:hypothetical protein